MVETRLWGPTIIGTESRPKAQLIAKTVFTAIMICLFLAGMPPRPFL